MPANIEIIDHITYDLAKVYYVMHHEAGISETDGPFTEREAYEFGEECLQKWVVLKLYDIPNDDHRKG
jgi:hypothetical protein